MTATSYGEHHKRTGKKTSKSPSSHKEGWSQVDNIFDDRTFIFLYVFTKHSSHLGVIFSRQTFVLKREVMQHSQVAMPCPSIA